jgi:hypothetical protein
MLKLLGWLLLIGVSFSAGYWAGQRPVGELRQSVADLSRRAVEQTGELTRKAVATTSDLERRLRQQQGVVEARERLVAAKSDLLDKNYGSAAKQLDAVLTELDRIPDEGSAQARAAVHSAAAHVREAKRQLASGKPVAKATLEQIQRGLDELGKRS